MDIFDEKSDDQPNQGTAPPRPLANRMRPDALGNFYGQEKIIGPGTPLRRAIEEGRVGSIIFWGPPGSGKTTLAYLIAKSCRGEFLRYSAVTSSITERFRIRSGSRLRSARHR